MKKTLLLLTVLCLLSFGCNLQTETKLPGSSTTVAIEKDYLKGLHMPTDEEKADLRFELTPNLSFYSEDGKKISFDELLPLLQSGSFSLDPYVDETHELKAAILRPATQEEKEMYAKMQGKNRSVSKDVIPFSVTDIKGNKFSLDDLKGKIIVMNFWFVECLPCIKEIPELNKVVDKYKGKEIVFIGFATNRKTRLDEFLKKNEFKYNIIPESNDVIRNYGISSFPTHIIIDQKSTITYSASGFGPGSIAELEKEIEKLHKS